MRNTFYLNSITTLVLSLCATQVQALEQYCEVRSDYVVRNESGRAVSTRLSGNQICVEDAQLRSFYVNGEVRQDYFREVRTSSGETYYVAASGVREGAPITPPVPRPRPSHLVQVSTPTQSQVIVESGYLLRSSPQQVDRQNVVGDTTSIQGFTPVFEDGVFQIENEYVKGVVNGREVWLHESAITLPSLTSIDIIAPSAPSVETSNPVVTPTETAPTVEAPTQPQALPPVESDVNLTEVESSDENSAGDATNFSPVSINPLALEQQEQLELRQRQQENDPNIEDTADTSVDDPSIPRPTTMPQGLRQRFAAQQAETLFGSLPAGNWGATTVNLNLRNRPGTEGTQVQGLLQSGGRVAVIDSETVNGRIWHQVIPFDCEDIIVSSAMDPNMFDEESSCNQSYWVAGSNIEPSTPPPADQISLRVSEANFTEAGFCTTCRFGESSTQGESIQSLGEQILAASEENNENLLEQYEEVQAEFLRDNPAPCAPPYALLEVRPCKIWARQSKAAFISLLIERMGEVNASKAILALTAWAEARGQGDGHWGEVGEMGMVMSVLDNRAVTNYATQNAYVGLSGDETPEESLAIRRMGATLYPAAFSAWNTTDVNLFKIMQVRSDQNTADSASLVTAFDTVQMFDRGEVAPVGELVERNTRHYYARNILPDWARFDVNRSGHVIEPQVRTPGGIVTIRAHTVRRGTQ